MASSSVAVVVDIAMPRLSDSMEEGLVVKWLVELGAAVSRGQPLVEIETDKATMTYESDDDGTIAELLAVEGDVVAVGHPIARLATEWPDATLPTPADHPHGAGPDEPRPALRAGLKVQRPAALAASEPRVAISPVARRMASASDIDFQGLTGSGPGGRIIKRDIEEAIEQRSRRSPDGRADAVSGEDANATAPPSPPAPPRPVGDVASATGGRGATRVQELTRLQQTVARRMAESKATAPDFALMATVAMDAAVALRTDLMKVAGDDGAPTLNDLVIRAAALALRGHLRANAAYRDGRWELYERINIGMAVAAGESLLVPTVFDADRKPLGDIARETRALAERARTGVLTANELAGGTFTVSNLGSFGVTRFTAVLNPPQAGILAVGAVEPRPGVSDGELTVGAYVDLTLTADHRILNGADAARLLSDIKTALEEPMRLVL